MTEPTEQIAARVAGLMGYLQPRPGLPCWDGQKYRHAPEDPAEVFRLMCEFNVWPRDMGSWMTVCKGGTGLLSCIHEIEVAHDNTHESRQQAATRAVLMAVELKLKEKQA